MTEDYTIVRAALRDLAEIPKIEQAAATVFSAQDLPEKLRYLVTDRDTLQQAQRDGRIWMAKDASGQALGFALAEVLDGEAHLDEVDVYPGHARRGIGTRLVEAVIAWAESRRFSTLTLITFRHLPWNARFYARFGFTPVPENELGPDVAEILRHEARAGINIANRVAMRRELARPATPGSSSDRCD